MVLARVSFSTRCCLYPSAWAVILVCRESILQRILKWLFESLEPLNTSTWHPFFPLVCYWLHIPVFLVGYIAMWQINLSNMIWLCQFIYLMDQLSHNCCLLNASYPDTWSIKRYLVLVCWGYMPSDPISSVTAPSECQSNLDLSLYTKLAQFISGEIIINSTPAWSLAEIHLVCATMISWYKLGRINQNSFCG